MPVTVTGTYPLARVATMVAVAAALDSAVGKPAGWTFQRSLEGRQDKTNKRGYFLLGDSAFAENDPEADGVLQRNTQTTTTVVETDYTVTLQAGTTDDLEAAVDFLWEAVPLAGPEVHEHLVLRIGDVESTMRGVEENALRTTIVRISATQLATTGGAIL